MITWIRKKFYFFQSTLAETNVQRNDNSYSAAPCESLRTKKNAYLVCREINVDSCLTVTSHGNEYTANIYVGDTSKIITRS